MISTSICFYMVSLAQPTYFFYYLCVVYNNLIVKYHYFQCQCQCSKTSRRLITPFYTDFLFTIPKH